MMAVSGIVQPSSCLFDVTVRVWIRRWEAYLQSQQLSQKYAGCDTMYFVMANLLNWLKEQYQLLNPMAMESTFRTSTTLPSQWIVRNKRGKTSNNNFFDDGIDDQVDNNSNELEGQDGSITVFERFGEDFPLKVHTYCATLWHTGALTYLKVVTKYSLTILHLRRPVVRSYHALKDATAEFQANASPGDGYGTAFYADGRLDDTTAQCRLWQAERDYGIFCKWKRHFRFVITINRNCSDSVQCLSRMRVLKRAAKKGFRMYAQREINIFSSSKSHPEFCNFSTSEEAWYWYQLQRVASGRKEGRSLNQIMWLSFAMILLKSVVLTW